MSGCFATLALIVAMLLSGCEDPSAEEFVRRAEGYLQDGNIPASIIELKNALQKDPRNPQARFLLGDAYLTIRDFENAEKELLRAREYGYSLDKLIAPLTRVWLEQGQFERVLNDLPVDAGGTNAHKAAVLVAHGRAHQALGSLEEAWQVFETALEHDPDSVNALVGLARVAMQQGDDADAENAAARAFEIAPNNLNVQAVEADLAFRRGDYVTAKESYRRILRVRPGSIAARVALARVEVALGESDQAKENLELVLARARTHPDANYLRASLAVAEGDFDSAARLSEQVLVTKPDHGPSLLIAGVSNYVLGRLDQAERHLSRLLAEDPSNRLARQIRAAVQSRSDRSRLPDRALGKLVDDTIEPQQLLSVVDPATQREQDLAAGRAFFESMVAGDSQLILAWPTVQFSDREPERLKLRSALNASSRDVAVLSELGRLEALAGNFAAAATLFESAIEADPYALAPRILLGQLHLGLGRPANSLKVSRVMLREHPKHPMLLALTGLAQLHKGETQEAKLTLRDLVDVQAGSPHAHYLLSLAYRDEGERSLYMDRLDQILALDSDHLWARLARARLLARSGDLDTAGVRVRELMRDAGEDPNVLDLAGSLALLNGQVEAAVARFQEVASISPSTIHTLKLAYAQQQAGDSEGSRATLESWLRDHPTDSDVRLAIANKYLELGEWERARARYAEMILYEPSNVVALNNLAWAALQMGEIDLALDYGERAYLSTPDDPRVLDTYGLALLRAGKTDRAQTMLRRAQKTSLQSAGISINLARALSRLGKAVEARQILDDLLSQSSEFPGRQEAEALRQEIGE